MKTLTGVRGRPDNTRVMIDTKVATGTEVYSKAARLARTAFFLRMMFISRLKQKEENVIQ